MRLLIVSDLHANPWALQAVEEKAGNVDYVICAGDTVSYGPDPIGSLNWLRQRQAIVVRGNHDHAAAFNTDPKASPAKQPMALAMRDWTRRQLEAADRLWLSRLPIQLTWEIGGIRITMVHATPLDCLYDYRLTPATADQLVETMVSGIRSDILITGHTHLPLKRKFNDLQIINPGSVGQPLNGDPRAAYALWEDGHLSLNRIEYDQAPLLKALESLPISKPLKDDLAIMIQKGSL